MTEEEERELRYRIARIDHRLGMLGGWGCGAVTLWLAYAIYENTKDNWGDVVAIAAAFIIAGGMAWYFLYEFGSK